MPGDRTVEVEEPTPEQVKWRRVEAFAGRDTRHARLADALLGADDPVFAIASLLVDHEARIDQMVDRCGRLEFQLAQMKARRAVAGGDDPEAVGP